MHRDWFQRFNCDDLPTVALCRTARDGSAECVGPGRVQRVNVNPTVDNLRNFFLMPMAEMLGPSNCCQNRFSQASQQERL